MSLRDIRALSNAELQRDFQRARDQIERLDEQIAEARDRADAHGGSWNIDRIEQNRSRLERAVSELSHEVERRRSEQ